MTIATPFFKAHPLRKAFGASAALALALFSSQANAQETIDVGVLKNSDITVVQKVLYPKSGQMEFGGHAGWMPFDAYTSTPIISLTGGKHLSETLAAELAVGGGYSLKNRTHLLLEGPAYGIVPDAYAHIGSVMATALWSPIYAKMNWQGTRIFHHDIYGLAGIGAAYEQAMMPDASGNVAPALGLGVGARIFLKNGRALRIQIRDDLLWQTRVKTEDTQSHFLKQNVGLTVGYTFFKEGK